MKKNIFFNLLIILLMTILFVQLAKEEIIEVSEMNIIYTGDRNNKTIYLTFDDGFSKENTKNILEILKYHNVNATFFIYGEFMTYYPELIKTMVNDGYTVANHTMNHKRLDRLSKADIVKEVNDWENLYQKIMGRKSNMLFRPPQGVINKTAYQIVKELGYEIVKWDVQIYDYDIYNEQGEEYVIREVLKQTKNGSIILLHTMTKSNVLALETLIDELLKKGFRFGNLNDLVYKKI